MERLLACIVERAGFLDHPDGVRGAAVEPIAQASPEFGDE
jgi:hypothetical protein